MENGPFIVDLPVTNWIFHSYVQLPEGNKKCIRILKDGIPVGRDDSCLVRLV